MGAKIIVVLGSARFGKTDELLERYCRSSFGGNRVGGACHFKRIWLAPTNLAAGAVREALVQREGACLAPGVATFEGLARQIVHDSNERIRIISPFMQRELLRRIVADAKQRGDLKIYAAAAQQSAFIDSLAAHFAELRQRNIAPSTYKRTTQRRQTRQHELAHLFTNYCDLLNAHGLIDSAGVLSVARELLANGKCDSFGRLDIVAVDGFTDFTNAELELLQQLSQGANQTVISLVVDTHEVSRDLFTKATATLAELKRRFPKLEVITLPQRTPANAAIAYCAEQVFIHPHPVPPTNVHAALPAVEIVAASSEHDEIVQIARRIKSLLAARVRQTETAKNGIASANDILVVFRSLSGAVARLEETLIDYGIPYLIETRPRVSRCGLYRTIRSLLQLNADDWPFRRVVAVVTNRMIRAMDEPNRRAADWLVRDLQIANGRQALLDAVAELAAQLERASQLSNHQTQRAAAAILTLPIIQRLAGALDRLPQAATASEWVVALQVLCFELGLLLSSSPAESRSNTHGDATDSSSLDAAQLEVWNAIANQLLSVDRIDRWRGQPPRQRNLQELLSLLADIATKEPLPKSSREAGGVRILSAPSARTESARHLFLAGMSEQAFPAGMPSGRLANENDYRFLRNAADQKGTRTQPTCEAISPASVHARDEMLLFYEILTRAQETLTISYPAMDDKAQELPPSPYVVELQRIFRDSEQQIRVTKSQLSPVPHVAASFRDVDFPQPVEDIYSVADWRISAAATAVASNGDCRLLAGLLACDTAKPTAQAIDAGMRVVHARVHGETHGPYEGVLINPAITKRLSDRFGKRHTWSPSQFETYAACPYKFFLATVLGLEQLGDLALETDFARRGSLLHHVLATFHRRYSESPSDWQALWRDDSRFAAELKRSLGLAFTGTPQEGIDAALLELDRRQIDKWTDAYRDQYEAYDKSWAKLDEPPRPTHFELRFGRKHAGEEGYEDPNSVDNAFQLDIGREKIHVAGRIDRIDVGRAGGRTVFNVIDYKSGKRPTLTAEKIESGERLQPALYVMAAQALVFGDEHATPLWAGYWSLRDGVTTRKGSSLHCAVESGESTSDWQDLRPKVIARIAEIVHAARRGDFPVNSIDAFCTSHCEFKTVCRVGQVRSVAKVWAPPASDA